MRVGINLVGVSYNDGKHGRYRNYEDAIQSLKDKIEKPLTDEGHEVSYHITTYDSEKRFDILKAYNPMSSEFLDSSLNVLGGGDLLWTGMKAISQTYLKSLHKLTEIPLDFVISTRFDILFNETPKLDFDKFNFIFREPEYTHLPLVSDTFYAFPHYLTTGVMNAIHHMETNPPKGINIAMHNLYLPMIDELGEDNINIIYKEYYTSANNKIFTLTRKD
jgi:hypothetical protein